MPASSPTPMQKLRQSFIAGLLVLLPVFITAKILIFAFNLVDGVLGPRLTLLISLLIHGDDRIKHIPGAGLITTLVLVLVVGYSTRYFYFQRIVTWFEAWLDRVPIARSIYSAAKQVMRPFEGETALPFSQVVLIEYPMPGRFTLGLLAQEHVDDGRAGADDLVVVFIPSNHLHLGYPVVLRRDEVRPLDMTTPDAIKFLVSCGAVLNDRIDTQRVLKAPSKAPPLAPVAPPAEG